MNCQKRSFAYALFFYTLLSFLVSDKPLFAQPNIRIFHTQQKESVSANTPYLGRDLWFCIPQNYESTQQQDKFYHVYVTSDRSTTVNFQISGQAVLKKPLTKDKVISFDAFSNYPGDFPITTEVKTSGVVVPDKAIHVWSDDADISVYLLSSVPFSTDGAYIVPTTGWGSEYVVAAYKDLFQPGPPQDWPSEFAIIANQDNTTVQITPAWDLRQDGLPHVIQHPRGIPFTEKLNKGQCIQYQAIYDTEDPDCDVTGTYITSDNPIGVMGASAAPYLPGPAPLDCCGDYVMDMMQPTRTWSNSYFTCPFANRTVSGDMFLVIGTQNGQAIKQNGQQVALVDKFKFTISNYIVDVHGASLWTSDAPFMLVQYMEGQNHNESDPGNPNPAKINAAGDPCDVVINATDLFSKKIVFQTPVINSVRTQQNTFTNYVNVVLPTSEEAKTTFDGAPLSGANPKNVVSRVKLPIGGTGWEAIQYTFKKGSGEGAHIIVSDTGVGVYIYGQGSYESYAWSGALGIHNVKDPDTIPPVAIPSGPCLCANVRVSDAGPGQSGLASFGPDSSYNMTYIPDPNFIPGGNNQENSYYNMCVIDSSLEAYLAVSIFDKAGNRTTVISQYKPALVKFSPTPIGFGTVPVGNTAFKYDTICNIGTAPFHFHGSNLTFTNGQQTDPLGFTIDSTGADADIPPGGCRVIKIKVTAIFPPTVKDTLSLKDECLSLPVNMTVNGGQPDFDIGPYSFDCTPINGNRGSVGYAITNPSGIPSKIDSIWISPDIINFKFDYTDPKNKLPITVPASNLQSAGGDTIVVRFNPQTVGAFKTVIFVKSGNIVKADTIYGLSCAPDIVRDSVTNLTTCDNPITLKVPITNKAYLFGFHDSIISVTGKSTATGMGPVIVMDANDSVWKTPFSLDTGKTVYASVNYTPVLKTSGCFTDSIIIIQQNGERAVDNPVSYITVCVKYYEATVTHNIDYGTQPVGGPKVLDSFEVCNTGADPLTINKIDSLNFHSSSFQLTGVYKVGGATRLVLPITLNVGECLEIYATFDPSNSNVTTQTDSFVVNTNDCVTQAKLMYAQANLSTTIPSILGFSDPPLFSCDVHTDSLSFKNPTLLNGTIKTITIGPGGDVANFASQQAPPIAVPAGATVKIPIQFIPAAQAATKTYTTTVTLGFDNGSGPKPYTTTITAVGQGMDLAVTSQFAVPAQSAGTIVDLPIQVSLNKHALNTPLPFLNINRIELTYSYDQSILDIANNNLAGAVIFPNGSTWKVDLATSKIDPITNTLQLNLVNTNVLTDADITAPIANIAFKASLPKTGSSTPVQLTASNFINTSNQPVANCLAVTRKDSSFSLIYLCGDSTLQNFMKGVIPMRAYPVNPNPAGGASSNILDFKYSASQSGEVTLEIFDELGRQVARVIDNQNLPAGTYEVHYNSSGLTEGTYIYRYSLNNKHVTSGRFIIQK
jgi:hypothetical protein